MIQIVQFLFTDTPSSQSRHPRLYSPTSYSPPANVEAGICEIPHPFPTQPPISRPHKMTLLAESKRIAAEFEFTDEDVGRNVAEFIRQMSGYPVILR